MNKKDSINRSKILSKFLDLCTKEVKEQYSEIVITLGEQGAQASGKRRPLNDVVRHFGYLSQHTLDKL